MATNLSRFSFGLALIASAALSFAQSLKVGSPAPPIKVSKWVKGTAVADVSKGGPYVVEFWATWCGPCKESIPHLTEMAKKFKGKVTFVGVSAFENDQALVEPFVKEMGDKMDYNVAMDKQDSPTARGTGVMGKDWMDAAGQDGIPTAFVVKDGTIQWIGHPMQLEPVLDKVVANTFDAKGTAAKSEAENAQRIKAREAWMKHPVRLELEKIGHLADGGKFADAIKELDVLEKMDGSNSMVDPKAYAITTRPIFYARLGDADSAVRSGEIAFNSIKDDAMELNSLAWGLVDPEAKAPKGVFSFAIKVASRAVELTNRKEPAVLDTLAWAYFGTGDKAKALATEREASALVSGADKKSFEDTIKKFQAG